MEQWRKEGWDMVELCVCEGIEGVQEGVQKGCDGGWAVMLVVVVVVPAMLVLIEDEMMMLLYNIQSVSS